MHGADERALDEPVPAERLHDRLFVAVPLEIDVDADRPLARGEKCKRVVERRELGRGAAKVGERLGSDATGRCAVTHLE